MPAAPMHAPAANRCGLLLDRAEAEARRVAERREIRDAKAELAALLEAHRHLLLACDAYHPVGESDLLSTVEIALTDANWKLARLQRDQATRAARR